MNEEQPKKVKGRQKGSKSGRIKDLREREGVRLGLIGARHNLSLSTTELSKITGINQGHISKIELGDVNLSEDGWKILKKALHVRYVEEIWERYTYKQGVWYGDDGSVIVTKEAENFK